MVAQTYFTVWAAILAGMGFGLGFSLLLKPLSDWGVVVLVIALLGMAYGSSHYGYLLIEPAVIEGKE